MAFDAAEYAQAMEKFIIKMKEIPELIHPGTQEAMEGICKSLGIARVEAVFYEVLEQEEQKWGGNAIFYRGGEFDKKHSLDYWEQTEEGNMIGKITAEGQHELIESAPDNGAEIEAVMQLAESRR